MPVINSKKDWWKVADENWVNLLIIMDKFRILEKNMTIEAVVEEEYLTPLAARATKWREEKDHEKLSLLFQQTWGNAPDTPLLSKIPGWWALCDLCSESWVFDDD